MGAVSSSKASKVKTHSRCAQGALHSCSSCPCGMAELFLYVSHVMQKHAALPWCCIQVDVAMDDTNTQIMTIKTDVEAGRLLLHWGVEGGKNYKGGWRLPDHHCRPDGTQQYKDRALQTPFK